MKAVHRLRSWLWDHVNPIRRSAHSELILDLDEAERNYEAVATRLCAAERRIDGLTGTTTWQRLKIAELERQNESLKQAAQALLKGTKIEDHGRVIDRPAHRIVLEIPDYAVLAGRDVGSVIGEMITERIRQRTLDEQVQRGETKP